MLALIVKSMVRSLLNAIERVILETVLTGQDYGENTGKVFNLK